MKKLKIYLSAFSIVAGMGSLNAQDIHFSQIEYSSTMLNPAYTGLFKGKMRAVANYKNQWLALGSTFQTFGLSVDGKIKKPEWKNFALGLGGYFFSDFAGDAKLGTTDCMFNVSSHIKIGGHSQLIAGINTGFGYYSIDAGAMRWGDQYDGEGGYDPTITSLDYFTVDPFFNWDIGAGLAYSYRKTQSTLSSKDQLGFDVGFSVSHINRPDLQFGDLGERKYMKFMFSGMGIIGLKNTNLTLFPSLLAAFQGPSNEILFGVRMMYAFQEASRHTGYIKEHGILFGAYHRFNDALIFSLGYQYTDVSLNISYDINLSKLSQATSARGGLEISLQYVLGKSFYYQNPDTAPKPSIE